MSFLTNVGEVSTEGEEVIRWTISPFVQMPLEGGTGLYSPLFSFRGEERCQLRAYPNGVKSWNSEGWMGVDCFLGSLPSEEVFLSVVDKEGREVMHTRTEKDNAYYRNYKWIRRTELRLRTDELLPGGDLLIVCRVSPRGSRGQRRKETASGPQVGVTSSEDSCYSGTRSQNIYTEGSGGDVTNLSERSAFDIFKNTSKGLPNLIQNLKDLFVQGNDSDFVIRVRGREFRTHRLLLKTRIPAFDAMLTHNMAEKNEGVVKIEDCEPDVFNEFLLFVYTGRVENICHENMCELYALADKYGLYDLKDICLDFMKSCLSIECICDVVCISCTHGEAELLKLATEFFVKNVEEIVVTVKWQQFLTENPIQGNELFLKVLKVGKTKATNEVKRK